MRKLLLFIFFTFTFATDDLSILLNNLEVESDLSKKTKKESLGHYIIFTRNDLNSMEVEKLSDILKYIPLTSTQKTRFGTYETTELGSAGNYPSSIKLFLNNKDLSDTYNNSSFFNYYNLPLTFIDHIEIYIGAAAVTLGNTPSSLIIKLYTKFPKREEATIINNSISNNGSYQNDIFVAKTIDKDNSYLIMLNNLESDNKKTKIHNRNISSNKNQKYLYANYKHKNSLFELSSYYINGKSFMGLSKDNSPDNITSNNKNYSLNYRLNKEKYKLSLSYSHKNKFNEESNKKDDGGIYSFIDDENITYYKEKRELGKFEFLLSRKFNFDKNSLFTAISSSLLQNRVDELKYSTNDETATKDGKRFVTINDIYIYSIMAENKHSFNDRNLLFTSLKYDFYKGEANYKSSNNYIVRLGFISIPIDSLKVKTFLTKSYMPISIMQQEFAKKPLEQPSGNIASIETSYEKEKNYFSILLGHSIMNNMIAYTENGAINIDNVIVASFIKLNYSYKFSIFSKIDTSYSRTFVDKNLNSKEKVTMLLFHKYRKFNIFSGLVHYSNYKYQNMSIKESYNVDLGVKYNLNKVISLTLKGQNILNNSLKEGYKTEFEEGNYQSEEQKFSFELGVSF